MTGVHAPAEVRLAKRLVPEGSCLVFEGARNGNNYGTIRGPRGGATMLAHRLAWELKHGLIPDGRVVCHVCDNPPCCNVAHLFLGSVADNNNDRARKDRGVRGTRVHTARLNETLVVEIRERHAAGESGYSLAREYGVTSSTMHSLLTRKTWARVGDAA